VATMMIVKLTMTRLLYYPVSHLLHLTVELSIGPC